MKNIHLAAFFVASVVAVVLGLCFAFDNVNAKGGAAVFELESRINPNDAPAAGLMMLPGIGMARAQAIISYREQFRQNHPDELPFQNCRDLDKVKGIGPVTLGNICEHLKFK